MYLIILGRRVHIMKVYKGYEGYKGDDLPKDMT